MHFLVLPHRPGKAVTLVAAVLGCALGSGISVAQPYTLQPIKIIVPYTPGTGNDILARTIGHRITERWKTPVVVENRPGASGNIGTAAVARAAPHGLTLLVAPNNFVINPYVFKNVQYVSAELISNAELDNQKSIDRYLASADTKKSRNTPED